MLDTVVQQNTRDMVLKVLRFGTQKLFSEKEQATDKTEEVKNQAETPTSPQNPENDDMVGVEKRKEVYEMDREALNKILDREAHFKGGSQTGLEEKTHEELEEDKLAGATGGIEDYLSAFKVANFDNKGMETTVQKSTPLKKNLSDDNQFFDLDDIGSADEDSDVEKQPDFFQKLYA